MKPKKKGVYLRVCANHPDRTESLRYVYNGIPDQRSGQLLCKECQNGSSSESNEREMLDVRTGNVEQETSTDV